MINIKLLLKCLPAIVVIFLLIAAYQKGREDHEKTVIIENVRKQEALNEIRNTPIDVNNVIDILRTGKF